MATVKVKGKIQGRTKAGAVNQNPEREVVEFILQIQLQWKKT